MKGNGYRKLYEIDRFSRWFTCKHHRLNKLRRQKRESRRAVRRALKAGIL